MEGGIPSPDDIKKKIISYFYYENGTKKPPTINDDPLVHIRENNIRKGVSSDYTPKGATLNGADVNASIQDYYDYMKDYNEKERTYREFVNEQQQQNWETSMDFEKAKFLYQQQLNDLQNARDDTTYQRTVIDLAKAGVNPLMASRLGQDSATLGAVAGNAVSGPNLQAGNPSPIQSQANVVAQNVNSLRDYEIMQRQLELDEEKIAEEKRKNRAAEQSSKEALNAQIKNWEDQLNKAGVELANANLQAENERNFKQAILEAEHAARIAELNAKYTNDKELQKEAAEQKQKLQDSMNKIQSIKTGNEIVDTVATIILKIIEILK